MGPSSEDIHQQQNAASPTTQVLPSYSETTSSASPSEPTAHSQNEPQPLAQSPSNSTEPTALSQNESTPTTQTIPTNNQPTTLPSQANEPQITETEPPQNFHKMQTKAKKNHQTYPETNSYGCRKNKCKT